MPNNKVIIFSFMFLSICFSNDDILLEEIEVSTHRLSAKQTQINSDKIRSSLISTQKDLVKNQVGVSITDGGRSGVNGFTIRGVDKDRVSVKVDGIEAAQSFAPTFHQKQGFISGARGGTEIENLSNIHIYKGANSLNSGNGALGGAVFMQTKSAHDFVESGKTTGFYSKTAYSSKNSEFRQVLGSGFIYNGFEGLFQYTRRVGSELKSYYNGKIDDLDICGKDIANKDYNKYCGAGRILPDPTSYRTKSYLTKFGYRFGDDSFINLFYEKQSIDSSIEEKSFPASRNQTFTIDKTPYKRYGISYEYMPSDSFLEELKVQFSKQAINQIYNQNSCVFRNCNNQDSKFERSTNIKQDKSQIDLNLNTIDLPIASSYHSFYFGLGFGRDNFKNSGFWSELIKNKREIRLDDANGKKLIKDENGIPILVPSIKGKLGIKKTTGWFSKELLTLDGKILKLPWFAMDGKVYVLDGNFIYTRPIRTDNYYIYLKEYIQLNDRLSGILGIRYDKIKHNLKASSKLGAATGELAKDTTKSIWNMQDHKAYSNFSYNTGLKYEIFDDTFLEYSFNTAFRAPKIQESFIEFIQGTKHFKSNFDLKTEKAFNHEIELSSDFKYGAFSLLAFYTKYKNFIDYSVNNIVEKVEELDPNTWETVWRDKVVGTRYQYQNINSAHIKGLELNARIGTEDGLFGVFMASYQKGSKNDGSSLMGVSPLTFAAGVGYNDRQFSILLSAKYQKSKNPKDAMYFLNDNSGVSKKEDIKLESYPILSNSFLVFDFVAEYRVSDNFKLNAGIFNIFDKKYITWDSIREAKENGSMSFIAKQENHEGSGWQRLTSPGRNFAFSFEVKF